MAHLGLDGGAAAAAGAGAEVAEEALVPDPVRKLGLPADLADRIVLQSTNHQRPSLAPD